MKYTVIVLILVSALAVGYSQTTPTPQEPEQSVSAKGEVRADTAKVDICEAVLRRQFEITQAQAKAYFVGIENADPSPELMYRFALHKPPIKADSTFVQGAGVRIWISKIEMQSDSVAVVLAQHWTGNLGRGVYKHTVKKENGKWTVTKDELLAQS